jgi:hypothetical protein
MVVELDESAINCDVGVDVGEVSAESDDSIGGGSADARFTILATQSFAHSKRIADAIK